MFQSLPQQVVPAGKIVLNVLPSVNYAKTSPAPLLKLKYILMTATQDNDDILEEGGVGDFDDDLNEE